MKKYFPFTFILFFVILFFWKFWFRGLLPIPSDTIVGLYHPFRDQFSSQYQNGIPFKNFLITDPVRQQYPWKKLSIEIIKKNELPFWNPYSLSGTPLIANHQSGVFYPLNLLFFIIPFNYAWGVFIFLQPLLAGIFMFAYLFSLKLKKTASLLGAFTFSFSGFFIAWLEWGTILHVALWTPLIFLSIDKFIGIKERRRLYWSIIFIFSFLSAFFAGHLQIFFYLGIISLLYFLFRLIDIKEKGRAVLHFFSLCFIFLFLSLIQLVPLLKFIALSGREIDKVNWQESAGWFVPWQHLLQFIAPDFFGNPTTLNYFGTWNYGELIGFVGIFSLAMAFFALFFRRERNVFFFGLLFFIALIFMLPTIFAKIPYLLNIPLLSSSQPTRLMFVADLALSILAAFGFDYFMEKKIKTALVPILLILGILSFIFVLISYNISILGKENIEFLLVSKRNLIFPILITLLSSILMIAYLITKNKKISAAIIIGIFVVLLIDLFRFGWKFTPFTAQNYLFPNNKTLEYIQKNAGVNRTMSIDPRIFPPNFSSVYHIYSVEGYDPLFINRYAELMAAVKRDRADVSAPFNFNRIITLDNYDSRITNLMGVGYIFSLQDIVSEQMEKVFQEGETRVYKNNSAFPRVFFVNKLKPARSKEEAIKLLFDKDTDLSKTAIVEKNDFTSFDFNQGKAKIVKYEEGKILIEVDVKEKGFLILTDTYHPLWHVRIKKDNKWQEGKIYLTNYAFRGVLVPGGSSSVEFYVTF